MKRRRTSFSARGRRWKELARHPERIDIVLDKMLAHFLAHPDPNGFKAQLVAVDRNGMRPLQGTRSTRSCKARGLPPEWSDVIISEGAERRAGTGALSLRETEAGRTDRLLQAYAAGVGAVES